MKKIPVADFLGAMGRTKHLLNPEFSKNTIRNAEKYRFKMGKTKG